MERIAIDLMGMTITADGFYGVIVAGIVALAVIALKWPRRRRRNSQ